MSSNMHFGWPGSMPILPVAMTTEEPFSTLHDDAFRSVATVAPRRVPGGRGADIGGRLRVSRILQSAGIASSGQPVRIAGSSNEVWRAGSYVVRVGFQPGAERLRREGRIASCLPESVAYPPVIASGVEPFGEWIVVRHVPGIPLSEAWGAMPVEQRRSAVFELGRALKELHAVKVEASDVPFPEGEGMLALPHQLPVARILELLEQARYLHDMDRGLIDEAISRAGSLGDAFASEKPFGLVHGDLHFENVLVDHGRLSALLDFEWARCGPTEIDVDVLARFCFDPAMHIGGQYAVDATTFKDVLRWVNSVYPELFAGSRFRDRLFLCALSFDVPWLLRMWTNDSHDLPRWHPLNQIRDLMILGSHAERLGWH